jgi:diaminohydroxyphosphoribosylaminopyrimidine deaminase/5-amino-6-(5-phosphoribosylamino)uracil reductase
MRRCFDLARLGAQTASPNPLVGAVLVHQNRIIGEGYHHARGGAHAEVNAIKSVAKADHAKIAESTIYISLEPCCHHGLTPPCTELILAYKIPNVVISVIDPNPQVSGLGVERLRAQGVSVTTGILLGEGLHLLSNFRSAMTQQRPYIIVKFVQSSDQYIGHPDYQVWLSNAYEKTLVHKLRSEVDGIMVGTNTVLVDNPKLNNREYFGKSPVRITFDRTNRIPKEYHILDGSIPTLVYTYGHMQKQTATGGTGDTNAPQTASITKSRFNTEQIDHAVRKVSPEYIPLTFDDNMLQNCLTDLGRRNIQSVLVEGGASLIKSFVQNDLWDEAWVVTTKHELKGGVKAPLVHGHLLQKLQLDTDQIQIIKRV